MEGAVAIAFKPTFWDRTTWLLHDPYCEESLDRVLISERLQALADSKPDIISVGDSSGFFSIQPTIVNRYTRGLKYINLSTGGNHTLDGFKGIAEYMLEHSKSIKYVVLYILPFRNSEDVLFRVATDGRILREVLTGLRSYIMPPSAGLAGPVKAGLFENRKYGSYPLSTHKVYLEMKDTVQQSLGWVPEHDLRFDRVGELLFFASDQRSWYKRILFSEQSFIYSQLDEMAGITRKHGAKLVVVFQPMPARTIVPHEPHRIAAEQAIERFQDDNPD